MAYHAGLPLPPLLTAPGGTFDIASPSHLQVTSVQVGFEERQLTNSGANRKDLIRRHPGLARMIRIYLEPVPGLSEAFFQPHARFPSHSLLCVRWINDASTLFARLCRTVKRRGRTRQKLAQQGEQPVYRHFLPCSDVHHKWVGLS